MIFDGTVAECFIISMHQNVSTAKVRNIAPGVLYTFVFHQDARGGHSFLWPAVFRNATDVGRAPGQTSVHNFVGNGGYLDAITPGT
jgi:hypothetical protein